MSATLPGPPPRPPRGARSWPIAALPRRLAPPPRRPLPHRTPSLSALRCPARLRARGLRASRSAEPASGCPRPRSCGSCLAGASALFLELHWKGNRWVRGPNRASDGPCESGRTELGRLALATPGLRRPPSPCPMLTRSLSSRWSAAGLRRHLPGAEGAPGFPASPGTGECVRGGDRGAKHQVKGERSGGLLSARFCSKLRVQRPCLNLPHPQGAVPGWRGQDPGTARRRECGRIFAGA